MIVLPASAYSNTGSDNRWVDKNGVMHSGSNGETSSSIPINAHQYTYASKDDSPLGTIIKVTNPDVTLSDGSHPSIVTLKTDRAGRHKIDLVDGVATHALGITSTTARNGDITSVDNVNGSGVEPRLVIENIGEIKLDEKGDNNSVSQFQDLSHAINTGEKQISDLASIGSFKPGSDFEKNKDQKLISQADPSKVAIHTAAANKPRYRNPGSLTHQQRQKENEDYIDSLDQVATGGEYDFMQLLVMVLAFLFGDKVSPEGGQKLISMMSGHRNSGSFAHAGGSGPGNIATGSGGGTQNNDPAKNDLVINTIHPIMQASVREFVADLKSQGMDVIVRQGERSLQEQAALLAKGATTVDVSYHNFGLAVDIVPLKKEFYSNVENEDLTEKAKSMFRDTAKAHGFEWGGDWKNFVDEAHIQLKSSLVSLRQLPSLPKDAHGFVVIPQSRIPQEFVDATKREQAIAIAAKQHEGEVLSQAKLEGAIKDAPRSGAIKSEPSKQAEVISSQAYFEQYAAMLDEHKKRDEDTAKKGSLSPVQLLKQDVANVNIDPEKKLHSAKDLPVINKQSASLSLPA